MEKADRTSRRLMLGPTLTPERIRLSRTQNGCHPICLIDSRGGPPSVMTRPGPLRILTYNSCRITIIAARCRYLLVLYQIGIGQVQTEALGLSKDCKLCGFRVSTVQVHSENDTDHVLARVLSVPGSPFFGALVALRVSGYGFSC